MSHPNELPLLANVDAEQTVLGALMLDENAWDRIADLLTEADFYRPDHAAIFRHIAKQAKAGHRADAITVSDSLDAAGQGEIVGGIAYLATLVQNTPSASNIRRYAEIVKERSAERRMLEASARIAELATERDGRALAERQEEATKLLEAISESAASGAREYTAAEALMDGIRAIDERMARDGGIGGLSTGLSALDEQLDGLRGGELIVIGGRPSMGKSCLGEMISRVTAMEGGAVRFQSYEMPARDLMLRSAAANQGIPLEHIRKARMQHDEYDAFSAFCGLSAQWRLTIDADSSASVEKIVARARAQKRKHGLDLLVVDHLHLMPWKGDSETQGLGQITKTLKHLATDLNIPVVLLAQLNKDSARGGGRRPTLADLRGSGAIEQDADVVIFPHRPGYYDENANPAEAELIVAKSRNGPVGTVVVGWRGDYVRFQDQIPSDWNPPKRKVANGWKEEEAL